jgi:hypothetical protein
MRKVALGALALSAIVAVTVALLAASSGQRASGTARCSRARVAARKGSPVHTLIPPGNSSVSQYVENVPTAHGGCPSSAIGTHLSLHSARSSTLTRSAQGALLADGPDGAATMALARATAPGSAKSGLLGGAVPGASERVSERARSRSSAATAGSSPLQALAGALGGSSGGGGLGMILPIVLALCLLGTVLMLLQRRRMD